MFLIGLAVGLGLWLLSRTDWRDMGRDEGFPLFDAARREMDELDAWEAQDDPPTVATVIPFPDDGHSRRVPA